MKRLLAAILTLVVVISVFSGCGKKKSDGGSANDCSKKAALILQIGGLGDHGYNDASYAGMVKAKEELGIDFTCVEPKETADTETYLRQLGEQGYGLVICMEYGALEFVYKVAPLYPNTIYIATGATEKGNPHNLIGAIADIQDSSFLGGALAAYVATDGNEIIEGVGAKPGCKIGVVFGVESSGFYWYEDGFKHGARTVNPDCEVIVDYHGGFTDTQNVKNITENMINNLGCDVVWLCCGVAGLGGLQACRLNNALAIGVDTDQDNLEPGSVLTSIRSSIDIICRNYVKSWKEGTLYDKVDKDNVYRFSFERGEVGITDMSVVKSYVTNQENFSKLLALKDDISAKIISGEIEPWSYYDKQERYPYK